MGGPKKEKSSMNAERKKSWWEKNPGSHKKELQQRRENNKKEAKTIWKWDHRAKSNRKRKEKKIKGKSADYMVKTENSGSLVER